MKKEPCLCGDRDAQKVHKTSVLVTDNLDLVNETKAAKVITELLLGHALI